MDLINVCIKFRHFLAISTNTLKIYLLILYPGHITQFEHFNFSVVNVLLFNNPKSTIQYKNYCKILPILKMAGFKLSPKTIYTNTNC